MINYHVILDQTAWLWGKINEKQLEETIFMLYDFMWNR